MKTIYENLPKEKLIEKLEHVLSKLKSDMGEGVLLSSRVSFEPIREVPKYVGGSMSYASFSRTEDMSFEFTVRVEE